MDIQLPGMDGLELTRRLKADPKTRGIAILALTACAMKGDQKRMLAAGCDGYVAKPLDAKELWEDRGVDWRRSAGTTPPTGAMKVLVVDDNPILTNAPAEEGRRTRGSAQ